MYSVLSNINAFSDLLIKSILVAFLCSLVFINGPFNDSYIQSKYYVFVLGAIVFALGAIFRIKSQYKIHVNFISAGFLLFCTYLIVRGAFSHITFRNLLVPSALLLFLFFRTYHHHLLYSVVIVLLCIVQSIVGLLQLVGILDNGSNFHVVGSFDNPAGIASFLALGMPYCIMLCKHTAFRRYIGIAGCFLIVMTVILSQSRAGILAIITIAAIYTYKEYHLYILAYKKRIILIASICMLGLSVLLFVVKKDSALGRLLIWRTTLHMINDAPFGKGPNAFMKYYMEYQGEYFKHNQYSSFVQFADTTKYAFNEYLQVASEYGIIALLLFVLLFFCGIKVAVKNKDVFNVAFLVAVLVLSCFTYPFRYPIIWIMIIYSMEFISRSSKPCKLFKVPYWISKFVLLIWIICGTYALVKDFKFEYKWAKASQIPILDDYEELLENWNGNPFFLYNYGAELNSIGEYNKSLGIFAICNRYFNSYDMQMLIAENYFMLGNFHDAEMHYVNAANMCPVRFLPLQGLLRTYIKSQKLQMAEEVAKHIIHKETKVPSMTVSVIKEEARIFLNAKLH